jgi:hypothetical protein
MTRKQFGHFIVLWLFISFSSLFIGFRPSINSIGMGFYQLPMEVEFPHLPNPPKGHHRMCRLVVKHMGVYDCVRWMIVSFLVSVFFFPLIYWLWQCRRSVPREGDNVLATCDPRPGKHHCISINAATFRSVSNNLPL